MTGLENMTQICNNQTRKIISNQKQISLIELGKKLVRLDKDGKSKEYNNKKKKKKRKKERQQLIIMS
ncbi:hypothetical protein BLOT_001367 [Blomia tropicalis]|nr:hypothetical protein BLOT_001367 [Blomia tropicalis]